MYIILTSRRKAKAVALRLFHDQALNGAEENYSFQAFLIL